MKIIKVDFKNPKIEDIELIARYFKNGKVVVYPTDTIYGIGCDATNKKAIEKLKWKLEEQILKSFQNLAFQINPQFVG